MKRRSFNSLLLAVAATPVMAAQQVAAPEDIMPYTIVGPFEEDAHTVRLFFSFSCPFCRASHDMLAKWGRSIPREMEFRETPVIGNTTESLAAGMAFYTVRTIAGDRLPLFIEETYRQIQDRGRVAVDPQVYLESAIRAGIHGKDFLRISATKPLRDVVTAAAALTAAYRLRSTPAMSAGGRYLFTPEITRGVNENFITLANGVVSKVIAERTGGKT